MSYVHRNLLPLIVGLLASVVIVIGVGTVAVNAWGSQGLGDDQFERDLVRRLDGVPGASATLGVQLDPDLKVTVVIPHGPGELAGLRPDDRLLAVAGSEVRTVDEVRARLAAVPRNTEYAVTVTRGGQPTQLTATKGTTGGNLGGLFQRFTERMPQFGGTPAATPTSTPPAASPQQGVVLGVALQPATGGLRVISVTPNSPAAAAGIVTEDILTTANGRSTPSVEALQTILQSAGSGGVVTLSVMRGGQPMTLTALLSPRT